MGCLTLVSVWLLGKPSADEEGEIGFWEEHERKSLEEEGRQLSVSCVPAVQFDLKTLSQPRLCAVGVK